MSSTVDERIVEMTFDNKQFEQGVSTTIKSIDELKKSLKFDDAAKSLDAFQKNVSDIDLSSITDSIEFVKDRFSFFGKWINNFSDDVYSYIKGRVVGAINDLKNVLYIDTHQAMAGLREYETKMDAIQVLKGAVLTGGDMTITPEIDEKAKQIVYEGLYGTGEERIAALGEDYAAVQKRVDEIVANNWEWIESSEKVAYTMDDIDDTLEEMNVYADKTIYNFTQMTETLSKFTAAGVDLKEAQKVTIGLSNLAASAGVSNARMNAASIQMAQAMSKAHFDATDWMSLTSANMDTEQLRKALVAVGREMGVTEDILTAASKNIKNTLSEGWLTPEIFNQALAIFSDYETAVKYGMEDTYQMAMEAATKIRTVSMLKDTLTEEIQSEWTKSWELIIGSSDESSEALTRLHETLSDLLLPMHEARNENLQFWHDFGGREALINGITNVLEAFSKILKSVKLAWKELFPDDDKGGKWVSYSKAFETFTEKLIMGRDTFNKLTRTFKGFFAVIDIGLNIITSLFRALSPVFDLFKKNKGEKGLLDYTASLGDFLVALHDGAIESDFFYNIFSKVVDFILSVPEKIGSAIHALEEYLGVDFSDIFHSAYETVKNFVVDVVTTIADFKNIDTSGVGSFASSVKEKLGPLGKVGAFLSGFWEVLKAVAVKFAPVFKAIGSVVSDGLGKLKESILGGLENVDSDKIVDLIMSGSVVALIWKIIGVINDFKDNISGKNGFGAILANVNDILSGFQETLSAFTLSVKADALLKIAAAVAILAASMWALTKVDKSGLEMAIQAIMSAFVELLVSLKMLSVAGPAVVVTATAMLIMVGAVIELAGAMAILSLMDPDAIAQGTVTIAILVGILTKAITKLGGLYQPALSVAAAIVTFSNAIIKLIGAMAIISMYNPTTIAKGIVAIAGVAFVLVASMRGLGKVNKDVIATAPAIMAFSNAMIKLAAAVWLFGSMDDEKLRNGGIAVVGIMTVMAATLYAIGSVKNDSKTILAMSVAIASLASSMVVMVGALALMRFVDSDEILLPVISIMGLIFMLGAAAKLVGDSYPALLSLSVALLSLGMAMVQISGALALVAAFDPYAVEAAGKAIAIVLGAVAVSMLLASKSGPLAAASVIAIASALYIFVKAIDVLAKYDVEDIVEPIIYALTTLVVALTIFMAVIGVVGDDIGKSFKGFAGMALALIALGAAVSMMALAFKDVDWDVLWKAGAAIAFLTAVMIIGGFAGGKIGTGMLMFGGALAVTSLAMLMFTDSIYLLVSAFEKLATADFSGLSSNIMSVCESIIQTAPAIGAAVFAIISNVVGYFDQIAVLMIQSLITMLDNGDQLVDAIAFSIVNLIAKALEVLEAVSYTLGSRLMGIFSKLFLGMAERIDELMDSMVVFVVALINGLSDALYDHKDEIAEALENLLISLLEVLAAILKPITDWLYSIGNVLKTGWIAISTFFKGVFSKIGTFFGNIIKTIGGFFTWITDGIWNFFSAIDDAWISILDFFGGIIDGVNGFIDWIVMGLNGFWNFVCGIFTGIVNFFIGIPDTLTDLGSSIATFFLGIVESIWGFLTSIWNGIVSFFVNLPSNLLSVITTIVESIKSVGSSIGSKIYRGFLTGITTIWTWFTDLPSNLITLLGTVWEDIKSVGKNIIDGFVEGLNSAWDAIKEWFDEHFGWIIDGIKELFDMHSPSKVMEEMGGNVVEGFQLGLVENEDDIYSAANDLGLGTMDSLNTSLASNPIDLTSLIGDSSLTPVLDMSQVDSQLGTLDASSFSINTSMNDQLSSQISTSMSDYTDYSEKVVNEISKLRTDVNAINTRLDGISVVLDTGALVGQLTTPINAQLGRLLAMSQRGLFK